MMGLSILDIKQSIVVRANPHPSILILHDTIDRIQIRTIRIPQVNALKSGTIGTIKSAIGSCPYISRRRLKQAIYLIAADA